MLLIGLHGNARYCAEHSQLGIWKGRYLERRARSPYAPLDPASITRAFVPPPKPALVLTSTMVRRWRKHLFKTTAKQSANSKKLRQMIRAAARLGVYGYTDVTLPAFEVPKSAPQHPDLDARARELLSQMKPLPSREVPIEELRDLLQR